MSGRVFFEQVIRDNLDIGRPDQVSLIFDRRIDAPRPRATPGRFRTRVITDGVTPSLHVDYKHTTIKQYHKEGQGAADRDHHQRHPRLRDRQTADESARPAGDRLLRQPAPAARPTTQPRPDHRQPTPCTAVTDPVITDTGTRIPGLRLGQPTQPRPARRAADLPAATPRLHQPRPARTSPPNSAACDPRHVTAGQITYDLRRLRVHGLITRIPHTHRYQVTDTGLHTAMFLTRLHDRLLPHRPGPAHRHHAPPGTAPRRRPRLPARHRRPHPRRRTRRLTTDRHHHRT